MKFARKMAGICKGVSHRDARDRLVGFGERSRGGEHAPLHPVFHRPAMQIALEQSLADARTNVRSASNFRNADGAFQMSVDPFDHSLDPFLLL